MAFELDNEEGPLLLELLKRRLDELAVEEHRSETWHYKDMLRHEHAVLERLRGRLEELQAGLKSPGVAAP